LAVAWRDETGQVVAELHGNHAQDGMRERVEQVLRAEGVLLVGAKIAYDMAVICAAWPELIPDVLRKYMSGEIEDVQLNEKLLNVSTHGGTDLLERPDGTWERLSYSLQVLERTYIGRDRGGEKAGDDALRMHYYLRDGERASEYPQDWFEYPLQDAEGALLVREAQVARDLEGRGSLHSCRFRALLDFAYQMVTVRGIALDQDYVLDMAEKLEAITDIGTMPDLVAAGFLLPAEPPRPHKNGAVDKATGEPKMTKGVDEQVREGTLRKWVGEWLLTNELPMRLTEKGEEVFGTEWLHSDDVEGMAPEERDAALSFASLAAEHLLFAAQSHPVIEQYARRKSVAKLFSAKSGLVRTMLGAECLHPNFDSVKETMRASSYGSDHYPSGNIQQIPNAIGDIDPRRAFVAREGYVYIDCDYSMLELCSVGQTTWDLFGRSGVVRCAHRELINAGVDLHSWLGSLFAQRKSPEFAQYARASGASTREEIYRLFKTMERGSSEELQKIYKRFRTFAKPVGLGKPGGMGDKTLVEYAASMGVSFSQKEAQEMGLYWHELYPEMKVFFAWANEQRDTLNPVRGYWADGKPKASYAYTTPMGVTRRGCSWTALCNGIGMQSPSAEGFSLAMVAQLWPSMVAEEGSPLYGGGVVAPIHDQILFETPLGGKDGGLERPRLAARELQRLMEQAMQVVFPDVTCRAEPVLCRSWSKDAKQTLNEKGELILWQPS